MQGLTRLHTSENLLDSFLHLELPEGIAQNIWWQGGKWGRISLFRRHVIPEDDNSTLGWFVSLHRQVNGARWCRRRSRGLIESQEVVRT